MKANVECKLGRKWTMKRFDAWEFQKTTCMYWVAGISEPSISISRMLSTRFLQAGRFDITNHLWHAAVMGPVLVLCRKKGKNMNQIYTYIYIWHKDIRYVRTLWKYWMINTINIINIIFNLWTNPTLSDIFFVQSDFRKSAKCEPSRSTKRRSQLLSYSLLDHWFPLWLSWTSGEGRFPQRI